MQNTIYFVIFTENKLHLQERKKHRNRVNSSISIPSQRTNVAKELYNHQRHRIKGQKVGRTDHRRRP